MSSFPTSLPVFTDPNPATSLSANNHAARHIQLDQELLAVITKVGIDASAATTSHDYKLNTVTGSAHAETQANKDTTTTLGTSDAKYPSQNAVKTYVDAFKAIAATLAGSESLSNKQLIAPIIASFVNATHTHQNAAGGGTLDLGAAGIANTMTFANLLSTIFSGQVLTQANAGNGGGTIWYINLGGIKLAWGQTGSVSGTTDRTVTLPTSFFTTVQSGMAIPVGGYSNTNQVVSNLASLGTTAIVITPMVILGSNPINGYAWFVIGT